MEQAIPINLPQEIDPGTNELQNRILMTLWRYRPEPLSMAEIYMCDGQQGPMTPYAMALNGLEVFHLVESQFFAGDYKSRLTKWGRLHLLGLVCIGKISVEEMVLATIPEGEDECSKAQQLMN